MKRYLVASVAWLALTGEAMADPIITPLAFALFAGPLGAVASFAAIYTGLQVVGVALAVGSQVVSALRRPKANPQDIKNTSKGAEGPGRHAFGTVRLAGKAAFGNTAGYNIYRLLLQCFEPVVNILDYRYNGRSVTVEDNGDVSSPPWAMQGGSNLNIKVKRATTTDTAWPDLVADFPDLWTEHHTINGISHMLLKVINPGTGDERFAKLLQGGVKECAIDANVGAFYDPRTDTSAFTRNGVLVTLHYFRQLKGIRDEFIDFDDIGDTATLADAMVTTKNGTAPRCQLSGGWEGPITTDIVLDMLESAGLQIRQTQEGKFTIRFLEDDPESEVTFYKRHIIDSFPQAGPEELKRPNKCVVKYFSPERGYEVAEVPLHARDPETSEYIGASWARIDDEIVKYGEHEFIAELVFCPDASQAQRIGRRMFYMARADYGLSKLNFSGKASWRRRTITLEIPDVGEDGASVFIKVRKGPARVLDEAGIVEIPWTMIPDELTVPWNPATMEVDPPPELPESTYQSDLATPAAPAEYAQVEYPDTTREIRIRFTGVLGGTIAEATRRNYTGGVPETWASMTEYRPSPIESDWYAYAAADYGGDDADFRVRLFNDDEGSNWSDRLEVRPVAIDNTAPDAPVLEQDDDEGNPLNSFRAKAGEALNVAYIEIQWADDFGGPWTTTALDSQNPIRPHETTSWRPIPTPGGFDWLRLVRAIAFSSNGTPSAASNIIALMGPSS